MDTVTSHYKLFCRIFKVYLLCVSLGFPELFSEWLPRASRSSAVALHSSVQQPLRELFIEEAVFRAPLRTGKETEAPVT